MTAVPYDVTAGHDVPWPDGDDAASVRAWLAPFAGRPSHQAITNVHAHVGVFVVHDTVVPYTVSCPPSYRVPDAERGPNDHDESYVTSPLAHYVGASRSELAAVTPPVRGAPWIDHTLRWVGSGLRHAGFDRAVYLNNRMVSTNLYPRLSRHAIEDVHDVALQAHPQHALVWRSLDAVRNAGTIEALAALGYVPVFARRIWYQDPASQAVRRKKSFRRDGAVVKRSGYRTLDVAEASGEPFERIRDLYERLYVDKHASANPRPTADTWKAWHRAGALQVRVLTAGDAIDGVYGFWSSNGVVTAPLFGYDTSAPEEVGLYRILSRVYADEARDRGWLVHASAGVGRFKRHRGAVPTHEWNMVFTRHLPSSTRAAWRVVTQLANGPGARIVERIET